MGVSLFATREKRPGRSAGAARFVDARPSDIDLTSPKRRTRVASSASIPRPPALGLASDQGVAPEQEGESMGASCALRMSRRGIQVDTLDEKLVELHRRISATRWPSRELVQDRSQGKDGHVAAWEEPELFLSELRAAFSSLR
jgi:hypothetical protein